MYATRFGAAPQAVGRVAMTMYITPRQQRFAAHSASARTSGPLQPSDLVRVTSDMRRFSITLAGSMPVALCIATLLLPTAVAAARAAYLLRISLCIP